MLALPAPQELGGVDDATISASQEESGITAIRGKNHVYTTVVTFNPHPQDFFTGKLRTLLTPPDERCNSCDRSG